MGIETNALPVAVIGAGPVGLAAAAHLVQAGLMPLVLEAGQSAASSLETWRHVRLFSPWRYNLDRAARALLAQAGWREPDAEGLPTAGELIERYLAPLAAHPALAPHIRFRHEVTAITREGFDKVKTAGRDSAPFVIRANTANGPVELRARAVIDASGTWSQPNPFGANGLPALGEPELAQYIDYGMPDIAGRDAARYAGRKVLVIGAGHSAAGNLIALADLAQRYPRTQIGWAIRGHNLQRVFGGGDADQLPARGALGMRLKALRDSGRLELHTDFRARALRETGGRITLAGEGGAEIDGIERIVAATGARPRLDLARELRLRLDPWLESTEALAPLIDPNQHSCGSVRPHGHRELAHPETGFYMAGAKSYGRAPNFLMATGYEQVRSIVAALAGDIAAADDVQLELPETGVCSTRFVYDDAPQSCCAPAAPAAGCCGGPAAPGADACCSCAGAPPQGASAKAGRC
jgi:thioredoxin reductase